MLSQPQTGSKYSDLIMKRPTGITVPDRLHSDNKPHWSQSIRWAPGRWDPMCNAPDKGNQILHVRGRNSETGEIFEPMHYACGGGEEQPPFDGWFVPYDPIANVGGFYEVHPDEWQPMRAYPHKIKYEDSLWNDDNLKYRPELLDPKVRDQIEKGVWRRAGGGVICKLCRLEYYTHHRLPNTGGLVQLCDTTLVKL